MNIILLLFAVLLTSTAHAGQIALTFDDAPMGSSALYSGPERTQRLIDVLKENKIEAAFFVNPERLNRNGGRGRIMAYSQAGHLIANHTYSHIDLRKSTPAQFIKEIDQADALLKQFPTYTKWFRYPYLHEGETVVARDEVRKHLQNIGYKNGYVTVDNYDYYLNDLVQSALKRKKEVDMPGVCKMLVDLMWDGIRYYDNVAKMHIGSVTHVLLMHENDVEARCLPDLIQKIRSNNWTIVSPKAAFDDKLLANEPDTLFLSQGRVAALAHVKTGTKYTSRWESPQALDQEWAKRKLVSDKK